MRDEEFPFISVVIPAYNEEKRIANAIEGILNQTYPKDKMEVIVVDDGSKDNTCGVASKYSIKLIHHDKNKGDSASRNTGAKHAIGDIIATTDSDDKVDENWLINISKHYNDLNLGAVLGSSCITYDCRNWQHRIIAELFICLRGSDAVKNIYDAKGKVGSNNSIGSNQAFKKSIFLKLGGYDTRLTAGMDQDIVWRIEKAGYKIVFEPSAVVYITPKDNFTKYIKSTYLRARGSIINYFKHINKITFRYLFSVGYIPLIIFILIFWVSFDLSLLFYIAAAITVSPMLYIIIKIIIGRKYVQKIMDMPLILFLGYLSFIASSIGILRGCFDYIMNYKKFQIKSIGSILSDEEQSA